MNGPRPASDGFSLIEVVIAIAVVALMFIGIIGLLGQGVVSEQTSSQQTAATSIAASIVADLRSTPNYATSLKSIRYGFTLPTPSTTTSTTIGAASSTPLSGVNPYYLFFDNSQNAIGTPTTSVPVASASGAAYLAMVYLTQNVSIGGAPAQTTYTARIVVSWPGLVPTITPSGSVDLVTQFRNH